MQRASDAKAKTKMLGECIGKASVLHSDRRRSRVASVADALTEVCRMAELIADMLLDVTGSKKPMRLAIYSPRWVKRRNAWACRFTIGSPLKVSQTIFGENSVQALLLALKTASSYLYGSRLYKEKKIGLYGEFGGNLGIPAPSCFLDIAPYPF